MNSILRLGPTNPICMRLVAGGSKRTRHLYIRSGYLAIIIITLLFALLSNSGTGFNSLRELASAGANAFSFVAYLQLGLICLLAPVFMAGAIAQEANPRTWDILLTTPLNALQIVLGNLLGRMFFIIALLFSSLPLFMVTQYFGGVPGRSIFLSYVIAAVAGIVVGAIAVALSVSRKAGRRAVFVFYITVVIYLGITWSLDAAYRVSLPGGGTNTTWVTPLNPFLALEVLLRYQTYTPLSGDQLIGRSWFTSIWLGAPVATFCWTGVLVSLGLVAWSTTFLRVIGQTVGQVPWYERIFRARQASSSPDGAVRRHPREVWSNPIAWREAVAKQSTLGKIVARWSFVSIGVLVAIVTVFWFHLGNMSLSALRQALLTILGTEIAIIGLTALNISASAISREREDGTLDLLLTTPLTASYYISGKLRGIVSFMVPMLAVPILTVWLCSIYVAFDGLANPAGVSVTATLMNARKVTLPFLLPEASFIMPVLLVPFTAFCAMVGLQWSLKTKGTIGSVIASVAVVLAVVGILSLCGFQGGQNLGTFGAVLASLSPSASISSLVYPESTIRDALEESVSGARVAITVGAIIAGVGYSFIVYGIHKSMLGPNGKNFDMTVRRLAGTS